MSDTFFISDLHLGHKNILNFSRQWRQGSTVGEHDHILIEKIRSRVVSKRDILYILGDVAFEVSKLELLQEIPGTKYLVRGNHDTFDLGVYRKYFKNVYGLYTKYGMWFSHAPVHPCELRGRINVHGHVHMNTISDFRYLNVCVEPLDGVPISLEEVRLTQKAMKELL